MNTRLSSVSLFMLRSKDEFHLVSPAASRSALPMSANPRSSYSPTSNFLNISAVNINSITAPARLQELQNFVDINDISILALSETKLDATIHPSLYSLKGFHSPILKNRTRKGGGVAIYVRNTLPFSPIPQLNSDFFETIWVKVKIKKTTLLLCSTYLPPHTDSDKRSEFLDYLSDSVLEAQKFCPGMIALVGDLNAGNCWLPNDAPYHSPITPFELKLKTTTETLNFTQLINSATRVQNYTHNLRDLAFVDQPDLIKYSGVAPTFSNIDHLPLLITLSLQTANESQTSTVTSWDYPRTNIEGLINALSNTDWKAIKKEDVDVAVDRLTSTILCVAKANIPTKTIKIRNDKPWFSSELRREMRKRDRLFKAAQRGNTERDWTKWRSQRNFVTHLNRKLKNETIKRKVDLLITSKKNPYKYHKIVKSITGFRSNSPMAPLIVGDEIITNNYEKSEALNSYFCSQTKIDVTEQHLKSLNEYSSSQAKTTREFHFTPITPQDVMRIINRMDTSKACGSDNIPAKLIKLMAAYIAEPLSDLFNKSIREGKYPTQWKLATVKPVYKGRGSPSEPESHRPISLLPCLSKIFEKLIFAQIYDHIHSNTLITEKQSGYRPGHNTELQLAYLCDRLYKSTDSGDDYTVIYLDISRYFEKIWHKGLLAKCDTEFGIRGKHLAWIKSYLSDRKQAVQVGQDVSAQLSLSAGVPQGSVLGPLLAIMYLNGLSGLTHNEMLFFADDSSLHARHNTDNVHHIQRSLQNDLDRIKSYGDNWIIKFNASKTTQQTFSNKQTRIPSLTFDGMAIPIRDSHKHLGVTISSDLRFKPHVNNILLKFNRTLSPLFPIASLIPRQILLQIYQMYIQPHLDYCDTVFDRHLTVFDKSRLEKAQNRAARLITATPRRTPTAGLRAELGWSTLHDRRHTHRLQLYHKIIFDDRVPNYIKDIIPKTRRSAIERDLRCTETTLITIPAARSASYARSLVPATTRLWNELPDKIREEGSYSMFKKTLSEYLNHITPDSYFSIGSKAGNSLLTQIRLNASNLNEHRIRLGKSGPKSCECGAPNENSEHFLLTCPLFKTERIELYNNLSQILGTSFQDIPHKKKIEIIIYGPPYLNKNISTDAALAVQRFILQTRRFG